MEQKAMAIQARRRFLSVSLPALALSGYSCSQGSKGKNAMTYRMGEKASVGKLVYNVTEAQWKTSLGESGTPRVPEHRFLLLTLTITNSGPETVGVPLLSVYSPSGKPTREVENGDHIPSWLGLLRMIKPVETVQGTIVFDV